MRTHHSALGQKRRSKHTGRPITSSARQRAQGRTRTIRSQVYPLGGNVHEQKSRPREGPEDKDDITSGRGNSTQYPARTHNQCQQRKVASPQRSRAPPPRCFFSSLQKFGGANCLRHFPHFLQELTAVGERAYAIAACA